jgi:preprotein translocase subunit YajC
LFIPTEESIKMKKQLLTFAVLALTSSLSYVSAQTPATAAAQPSQADKSITANGVIGHVTAINLTGKGMSVKTDAGNSVVAVYNDATSFIRAQPGSTTLEGATKITPAEISVGDRVLARGKLSDDQKSVMVRALVVMTKADIAKKHERDREEWKRRGILGTVTSVNAATKEVTVTTSTAEGPKPLLVDAASEKVVFRRYAPDSVKFADAKTSSFAELKVGDRLRALGERSADGARFMPEEIVSGAFRQLVGTVTAVDPATNEIKITTQDKRPLTIVVNQDSNLRRLPPMMAQMLAARAAGGGQGRGGGRPPGQAPGGEPGAGGGGGRGEGGGGGGGGGRRMGGFDPQDMLERMPQLTLAELKPGDMIVVSSTSGADPARLTAIALIAGMDAVINAIAARPATPNIAGGQDLGLPGGIDLGIGLP